MNTTIPLGGEVDSAEGSWLLHEIYHLGNGDEVVKEMFIFSCSTFTFLNDRPFSVCILHNSL